MQDEKDKKVPTCGRHVVEERTNISTANLRSQREVGHCHRSSADAFPTINDCHVLLHSAFDGCRSVWESGPKHCTILWMNRIVESSDILRCLDHLRSAYTIGFNGLGNSPEFPITRHAAALAQWGGAAALCPGGIRELFGGTAPGF